MTTPYRTANLGQCEPVGHELIIREEPLPRPGLNDKEFRYVELELSGGKVWKDFIRRGREDNLKD